MRALSDFKEGRHHRARGHRGGGPRPGHQGAAVRGELRAAERPGGLRAPHRSHRPCRRQRGRGLAGGPDEAPLLRDIEKLLRRTLPVAALPAFKIPPACGRRRATRECAPGGAIARGTGPQGPGRAGAVARRAPHGAHAPRATSRARVARCSLMHEVRAQRGVRGSLFSCGAAAASRMRT